MDIRLVCTTGFSVEKTFLLEKKVNGLGRASKNDIVLSDAFVSGQHAIIRMEAGGPVIEDASKNGTAVNGERITRTILKDGDEILIHPYTLKVEIPQVQPAEDTTRIISQPEKPEMRTAPATVPVDPVKNEAEVKLTPAVETGNEEEKNPKAEIPKARMIMYGVLAAGFIGLLLYGQFSGSDTVEQDGWQDRSARPAVPRTVSQPQHLATVPAEEKEPDLAEAVKIAESMFNDRTRSQNLYHSIVKLQEVFEAARRLHKAVPDEAKYRALLTEARRVLDETHGTLLAEAKILVKQKNYRGAVEVLAKITDLIPNQKDPRHRDALQRIMQYRKYIR